ncbi:MAG: response regulator [Rhodobacteraceae bacterium]|nr:response regulator [Paracoccaceae bacterium]
MIKLPGSPTPDRAAEIASQLEFLRKFDTTRIAATLMVSIMTVVFLPLWIVLLFLGIDYLFEAAGFRLLDGLDPDREPARYRLMLLTVFLMESSYLIPAVIIWHGDNTYCKAVAVGLVCMTLFQLASVRAIHLPIGVTGILGVVVTAGIGNAVYWLQRGDAAGLAASSFAVLGTSYYALAAMRSNHMLHRDLLRSERAAAAANQAKGRFVAQISHELRTPLNAILGMGEAELAEASHPRTQDRMHTLVASARELAVILDDVLEMSALGENVLPIRPQATNPQAVISATAALFQPLFEARGLTITLRNRGPMPDCVMLDPHRLRQCLSNLLSNALKFTETGCVSVSSVMATQTMLEIEVANPGPVIPLEQADAIFAPFNNRDGTGGGSGLGLAISRGLARKMGGDLIVLPSKSGALFRLSVAVTPCPPAVAESLPGQRPLPDWAGIRVLVVDDLATNRFVAKTYLNLFGATPSEAQSGEAALAALRSGGIDLVLLDMNMPGLSGEQTLAAIRALPGELGRVKVFAMTADASDDHRRAYLALGLDGFVAKPLTVDALARVRGDDAANGQAQ